MGLLPDITGLLDDPDVGGGQSFTILRTTFVRVKGRASAYEQSAIPATGSVQPADRNQLEQLPEGDRDRAVLVIRSKTPILMGDSDTLTDEILYHGERYKVLRTAEWQRWPGRFRSRRRA